MIYDAEAGGLDPEVHSVFQLGALVGDLDTGQIIDKFEAYHKLPSISDYKYTDKAIEVHGITPEEAYNKGIPTQELQEKFTDLWVNNGAQLLGGHNEASYDRLIVSKQVFGCSKQEFEANFSYRSLDSLPLIRLFTNHSEIKSGASLGQTVKALNIDTTPYGKDKYHAALFDSICCFLILCRFRQVFSQPEFAKALTNGLQ